MDKTMTNEKYVLSLMKKDFLIDIYFLVNDY